MESNDFIRSKTTINSVDLITSCLFVIINLIVLSDPILKNPEPINSFNYSNISKLFL
jgi:hypothetical protein